MHILIVGDSGEDYLMNTVKQLKKYDATIKFSALHTNPDQHSKQRAAKSGFFEKIFTYYKTTGAFGKLPGVNGLIKRIFEKQTERKVFKERYDQVFLFGFWPPAVRFYQRNKTHIKTIGGYMMGSDFIRIGERTDREKFLMAANDCKYIIAGSPALKKKMETSMLLQGTTIAMNFIGHAPMEALEEIQPMSSNTARQKFGLPEDRVIITVGYNSSKNQQHEKLVTALQHTVLPPNHLLLFPMAYGGSKKYIATIEKLLQESKMTFKILEEYYNEENIALLRKSTDIFIHAQETDNLSGSVQEHLYAGNIVITGTWHPYAVLKERGLKFFEFKHFEELPEILEDILEHLPEYTADIQEHNRPEKFEKSFWRSNIANWHRRITQS